MPQSKAKQGGAKSPSDAAAGKAAGQARRSTGVASTSAQHHDAHKPSGHAGSSSTNSSSNNTLHQVPHPPPKPRSTSTGKARQARAAASLLPQLQAQQIDPTRKVDKSDLGKGVVSQVFVPMNARMPARRTTSGSGGGTLMRLSDAESSTGAASRNNSMSGAESLTTSAPQTQRPSADHPADPTSTLTPGNPNHGTHTRTSNSSRLAVVIHEHHGGGGGEGEEEEEELPTSPFALKQRFDIAAAAEAAAAAAAGAAAASVPYKSIEEMQDVISKALASLNDHPRVGQDGAAGLKGGTSRSGGLPSQDDDKESGGEQGPQHHPQRRLQELASGDLPADGPPPSSPPQPPPSHSHSRPSPPQPQRPTSEETARRPGGVHLKPSSRDGQSGVAPQARASVSASASLVDAQRASGPPGQGAPDALADERPADGVTQQLSLGATTTGTLQSSASTIIVAAPDEEDEEEAEGGQEEEAQEGPPPRLAVAVPKAASAAVNRMKIHLQDLEPLGLRKSEPGAASPVAVPGSLATEGNLCQAGRSPLSAANSPGGLSQRSRALVPTIRSRSRMPSINRRSAAGGWGDGADDDSGAEGWEGAEGTPTKSATAAPHKDRSSNDQLPQGAVWSPNATTPTRRARAQSEGGSQAPWSPSTPPAVPRSPLALLTHVTEEPPVLDTSSSPRQPPNPPQRPQSGVLQQPQQQSQPEGPSAPAPAPLPATALPLPLQPQPPAKLQFNVSAAFFSAWGGSSSGDAGASKPLASSAAPAAADGTLVGSPGRAGGLIGRLGRSLTTTDQMAASKVARSVGHSASGAVAASGEGGGAAAGLQGLAEVEVVEGEAVRAFKRNVTFAS